jgi:hypothetical protein
MFTELTPLLTDRDGAVMVVTKCKDGLRLSLTLLPRDHEEDVEQVVLTGSAAELDAPAINLNPKPKKKSDAAKAEELREKIKAASGDSDAPTLFKL